MDNSNSKGYPFDKYRDKIDGLDSLNKLILSEKDRMRKKQSVARSVIDMICGQSLDPKSRKRMIRNMNLLQGRWPDLKANGLGMTMDVQREGGSTKKIRFGRNKINHYPMIDKIGQQAIASLMSRNMDILVKDYCKSSQIFKKEAQESNIAEKISQIYFEPIISRAQSALEGVPPDQKDVALLELLQQMVDPYIQLVMEDIQVPTEQLMNSLFKIVSRKTDLNYQFYKGANYQVATGCEFYKRTFSHGRVDIKAIAPFDSRWCLSQGSEFIEDGNWFGYDRYLTPVELVTDFHHIFGDKEYKEIEDMMVRIPESHFHAGDADHTISGNNAPEYLDVWVDAYGEANEDNTAYSPYNFIYNKDGGTWAKGIFGDINNAYRERKGIKLSYCTWRWLIKAKLIQRKIDDGNGGFDLVWEIEDESYKLNKSIGDIKEKMTAIPQTYEGYKVGDFYFNIRPVPYQYEEEMDYHKPKLGVYGAVYNTLDGSIKNMSFMDPMVPSQYRINALNDTLNDQIMNNLGDVLVVNEKTISKTKGGPEAFYNMLYKFKTIVDKGNTGNNSIYSVSTGGGNNIREAMELIRFYKNEMLQYGGTNEAEISSLGQYATRRNIEASLSSADRSKYRMFYINKKVRENVANAAMWGAFYAYKNNKTLIECYLNDEMAAHYQTNFNEIAGSPVRAEINESADSARNLEAYKQYLFNYLSAGGEVDVLADVLDSKTMEEARLIAKKAAIRNKKEQDQKSKADREAMIQVEKQRSDLEREVQDREDARAKLRSDQAIKSAYVYSLTQAHGNDVNENGQADFAEAKDKDRAMDWKIEKLRAETKLKEKQIMADSKKNTK